MKLIRLTTTDDLGVFSNIFNEDIIIEPNSRIALHSLTTQVNTENIIIDAQNDDVVYGLGGNTRTIHLAHNVYDKTNIDDFFNDFTYKLNSSLGLSESEIGREYLVSTAENNLVVQIKTGAILHANANFDNPDYQKYLGQTNVQLIKPSSRSTPLLKRSGGTDNSNDSFIYFKATQCKGVSVLRARLFKNDPLPSPLPDPAIPYGGFIIGYYSEPFTETTVIDTSKIVFGIKYERTTASTSNYKIFKDGVESTSAIAPIVNTVPTNPGVGKSNNDYLSIESYENKIRAKVYNATAGAGRENGLSIDENVYDHFTELYPFCVFVSSVTSISDIQFVTDPFYNDNNNEKMKLFPFETIDDDPVSAIPSLKANKVVNIFLQFNDIDLLRLLGFRQQRMPPSGFSETGPDGTAEFKAVRGLSFRDVADTYLVEMLNLNINSYDSIKQQHMNLLAVIPQFDAVRERLVYNAVYPVFLSLNNPYKINLREIRARILKEDLVPINTVGYSQITILIDN
jgi:hypothetical protein